MDQNFQDAREYLLQLTTQIQRLEKTVAKKKEIEECFSCVRIHLQYLREMESSGLISDNDNSLFEILGICFEGFVQASKMLGKEKILKLSSEIIDFSTLVTPTTKNGKENFANLLIIISEGVFIIGKNTLLTSLPQHDQQFDNYDSREIASLLSSSNTKSSETQKKLEILGKWELFSLFERVYIYLSLAKSVLESQENQNLSKIEKIDNLYEKIWITIQFYSLQDYIWCICLWINQNSLEVVDKIFQLLITTQHLQEAEFVVNCLLKNLPKEGHTLYRPSLTLLNQFKRISNFPNNSGRIKEPEINKVLTLSSEFKLILDSSRNSLNLQGNSTTSIRETLASFKYKISNEFLSRVEYLRETYLGPIPKGFDYCLLELGSPARSPFSDMEYIIIFQSIGEKDANVRELSFAKVYFTTWSKLIDLFVMFVGEKTPKPGFSVDHGNENSVYELKEITSMFEKEAGGIFAVSLVFVSYLSGNKLVFDNYKKIILHKQDYLKSLGGKLMTKFLKPPKEKEFSLKNQIILPIMCLLYGLTLSDPKRIEKLYNFEDQFGGYHEEKYLRNICLRFWNLSSSLEVFPPLLIREFHRSLDSVYYERYRLHLEMKEQIDTLKLTQIPPHLASVFENLVKPLRNVFVRIVNTGSLRRLTQDTLKNLLQKENWLDDTSWREIILPYQSNDLVSAKGNQVTVKGLRSGFWILKDHFANKLFGEDKSTLSIQGSYSTKGIHSVCDLGAIHVKENPSFPAIEFAISSFFRRLLPGSIPDCELVRFECNGVYRWCLLSESIRPPENNLFDILLKDPYLRDYQVDVVAYQKLVVLMMLIDQQDGKSDNFILIEDPETQRWKFICIDNEFAFCANSVVQKSMVQRMASRKELRVNVTNILFCMDQMRLPFQKKVIDWLKEIQITEIMAEWLYELCKQDHRLTGDFEIKEVDKLFQDYKQTNGKDGSVLRFLVNTSTMIRLHERFKYAQQMAIADTLLTPSTFLKRVDPLLGHFYEEQLAITNRTCTERFMLIQDGKYVVLGKNYLVTNRDQTLQSIVNNVPKDVQSLDSRVSINDTCSALMKSRYQKSLIWEAIRCLKSGEHSTWFVDIFMRVTEIQEIVICQTNFGEEFPRFSEQKRVLETLSTLKSDFKRIEILNAKALNTALAKKFMSHSPHLTDLAFIKCPNVDESITSSIQEARFLERLRLEYLPTFKFSSPLLNWNSTFEHNSLKQIRLVDCKGFTKLQLKCPALRTLTIKNCPNISAIHLDECPEINNFDIPADQISQITRFGEINLTKDATIAKINTISLEVAKRVQFNPVLDLVRKQGKEKLLITKAGRENSSDRNFKFSMVSGFGCDSGKSTLFVRLCKDYFLEKPRTAVGEYGKIQNSYGIVIHLFSLWTRVGPSVTPMYMFHQNVLFVYNICSKNSFERMKYWVEEYHRRGHKGFTALIGTHLDEKEKRQVLEQEAESFATENQIAYFSEVSSKTGEGVEALRAIMFEAYEYEHP